MEANNTFCDMLGYSHEEVLELNVADWDSQWVREELREKNREFRSGHGECWRPRIEGKTAGFSPSKSAWSA